MLAVMVRTSRLTLVLAEPGTEKSELLASGLLPRLQRRGSDRLLQRTADLDVPTSPERRLSRIGQAAHHRIEAAIYLDRWDDMATDRLLALVVELLPPAERGRIDSKATVAAALELLQEQFGIHTVVILDRFELILGTSVSPDARRRFLEEFCAAIQRPKLQASFLLALEEAAWPELAGLRRRVPALDDNILRIAPIAVPPKSNGSTSRDTGMAANRGWTTPAREASQPRPLKRGPPPRVPIKVDEVYAFIESTLAKTSVNGLRHPPAGSASASGPTVADQTPASTAASRAPRPPRERSDNNST